ncbi:hypothetical protein AA0119_g4494 [Alternaria tenuissima]|uniref:Uncharacterized protein n=2 Tax=Alternaria alternata complex TaxID=187734 RepID=A0A4Q4NBM6_ALTAL|nr:hypothetical protein AA0115_g7993 [Alternaria tenuissima]RYN73359.1 hypothetical protein AA0117_g7734 [Alternaria alternata]RYN61377.1 hypothetical protein AA0118_g5777 [Alternaria tenuissima]RYN92675.1 hypothetical protein AA0120_g4849 [Alternaria tenuissima]RYO03835.1 hypothetical protein AA0119_g4494 [Alternaria tenuissima]
MKLLLALATCPPRSATAWSFGRRAQLDVLAARGTQFYQLKSSLDGPTVDNQWVSLPASPSNIGIYVLTSSQHTASKFSLLRYKVTDT